MATVEKGIEVFFIEPVSEETVKIVIGNKDLVKELQRAESVKIIYEICDRREESGTEIFRIDHG